MYDYSYIYYTHPKHIQVLPVTDVHAGTLPQPPSWLNLSLSYGSSLRVLSLVYRVRYSCCYSKSLALLMLLLLLPLLLLLLVGGMGSCRHGVCRKVLWVVVVGWQVF